MYHGVPEIPRSALEVCSCSYWCRPPCNFPGNLRDSAQRRSPLPPQDSPQLAPWPTHMSRSHSSAWNRPAKKNVLICLMKSADIIFKTSVTISIKIILMYIYTNIFHVRFLPFQCFFQYCTEGKWQILVMFLTNDICCCFFFNNRFSCEITWYKRLNKQGTCRFNINNFVFFSHPIVYLVQSDPVSTRWHQLWILSHFVSENYILTCFPTFLHIKSHRSWKFLARKNLNTKEDPNV